VYVDRRKKVESGQRATSLYYMMNKPGLVGRILNKVQPENRALYFMLGQFGKCNYRQMRRLSSTYSVYAVLTGVPPVFLLYNSPFWSGTYLLFILSVSVWNGGGFYIEVFGRK
jgi:hypothetical protein